MRTEVDGVQAHLPGSSSAVGRDLELQAIDALMTGSGTVRCVVLAGDPGIGKTTVWERVERGGALTGVVVAGGLV